MSEYISEFQAPYYSILSRDIEGTNIVTTVVMHGEIMQFVAGIATRMAGYDLVSERESVNE